MAYRPRVRVSVQENVTLSPAEGQAIIAAIGTAQWGPVSSMQEFSSFSQFFEVFKEDKSGLTLTKALDIAYNNGASSVKVVRIASSAKVKATHNFLNGATPVLQVDGLYYGTYGNNIGVTILANGSARDVQVTDGVSLEIFDNNGLGYATNAAIASAINAGSNLVTATVLNSSLVDATSQTFLTGGNDGVSGLVDADYTGAIDNQLYNEDFNILLIPGKTDDSFHTTVVGKLNTRASSEDRFSVFLSGVAVDEAIATAKARVSSGMRLGVYAPAMKYTLRYDGTETALDGSYLACAIAGGMASRGVAESMTHKELSISDLQVSSTSGQKYYNNSEQESLLDGKIVPVSKIGGYLAASRAITRNSDKSSLFWEQNIVMLTDYIQGLVFLQLNPFIGDPNFLKNRKAIGRVVDGILEQAKRDEVISEYNSTEVVVGTSPDTVLVNMSFMPATAINFINVTMSLG